MTSLKPGVAVLNILLLIFTTAAENPIRNNKDTSGAILPPLYFSYNSAKISSYESKSSLTCSPQPSKFKSKGFNKAFPYSSVLITVENHHPCNFTLSFFLFSSKAPSYSSSTSSKSESIVKTEPCLYVPFSAHSSNFLIIIRFLRRFSRSVKFALLLGALGTSSFILLKPSHVFAPPS